MKEIKLTQGKVALVDDEDFEWLNQYNWWAQKAPNTYYVRGWVNGETVKMHHVILGKPPKGYMVDHADGNGLKNTRCNLRFVTKYQNQHNRNNGKRIETSKYPGVHWCKKDKRWVSKIVINGRKKYLGYFKSEYEAFLAYKQAVESLGETVLGNF